MANNAESRGFRVGIDLGTTNSLVSVVAASGAAEILSNRENEAITPSVVSLRRPRGGGQGEQVLIGRQATNNARLAPRDTICSIKRFIGLPFDDPRVSVASEHVSFELRKDPSGAGVVAKIGERLLTPEEVSSLVLRQLKEDAEARLGGPVMYAVITVPAYFEEHRRTATRRAGTLAGLTVLAILDEPTSAAISETVGEVDNARTLVFDFGGGTLDVSLIVRSRGNLNVKNYTGDAFLGGDDIDRGIAQLIEEHLLEAGGVIKPDDHRLLVMLRQEAEKAKKTLAGGLSTATVIMPSVCRTRDGDPLDLEMDISQEDFGQVLEPIEGRIRKLMQKFLETESLEPQHITEVLMVGGSSAVTRVQTLLQEIFEPDGVKRVRLARSPMESVAKGAAIYASRLKGLLCAKCKHENDLDASKCASCGEELVSAAFATGPVGGSGQITHTLPRSLGVRYRQGDDTDAFQAILKKGSLYPTQNPVAEQFQLPSTECFQVLIHEGNNTHASQNALIGVLSVEEIPPDVKKGDPVVVAFSYTRDRTLFVSVNYPTSRTQFEPRWKLDPPDSRGPSQNDPVRTLSEFLPDARRFVTDYADFMDTGARKKFTEDLNRANDAVLEGNVEEAKRLSHALNASIFNGCGTASTLFLAEHTVANEDAELGPTIKDAAGKLRQQREHRDPAEEATRKALEQAIMAALYKRRGGPAAEALSTDIIYRGTGVS